MESGQIKVGDYVLSVSDADSVLQDVVAMRLDDVVSRLRGPRDSSVTLGIKRVTPAGVELFNVALKRSRVSLTGQAVQFELLAHPIERESKLAYIRVPKLYKDFSAAARGEAEYASAARDVEKALTQAKAAGAKGLVLDLRGNGGGAFDEVAAVTDLFIDVGPVVQQRNSTGQISVLAAEETGQEWSAPLVVLVDAATASGAEMIAAALQDYQRAIIVGQTTYGTGTIQMIIDLDRYKEKRGGPSYGLLKLTVHKAYRASGKSIQLDGVTPDIEFAVAPNKGTKRERDKKYPLGSESVPAMKMEPAQAPVVSLVPELIKRHAARQQRASPAVNSTVAGSPAQDATVNMALWVLSDMLSLQVPEKQ
ncbi:MAG: S41 family peptidase [Pseudomonadota bacterium]